jgi:peptidoglycan L-alanyl-D-glutamate endopeptidase CwlK
MVRLAEVAIREFDFSIVCGHREEEAQERAFDEGTSRAHWGESPHNSIPSRAWDAVPWPSQYGDLALQYRLGHYILGVAAALEIPLKWGGDFTTFLDLPHFELI